MIYGIGVDLVAVARISAMHARYGDRLAEHILAPMEMDEYTAAREKDRFLAKRFAAKEAIAKALGTGLRPPVTLDSIAITHQPEGRPGFAFAAELETWLKARNILRVHLSISDEKDHAVAYVIAES